MTFADDATHAGASPDAADRLDEATFRPRREALLDYVVAHTDNPMRTEWGAHRCFDGYALAHFALNRDMPRGWTRLRETIEMIERNFADEDANPKYKFHLADFALHPLLRLHAMCRDAGARAGLERSAADAALWSRLEGVFRDFRWHDGDLTENHNLLHLVGRHLVGQRWPAARFRDGRTGQAHHEDVRAPILTWMDRWVTAGSVEWGADLYYNVNLLALLNLHDLSNDDTLRAAARAVLDLFILDEATDAFAGAMVGAARRCYGCYRVDARTSPSRPLQYLYFGHGGDVERHEPFNLNFIGGAILAAVSNYRPPNAITRIARSRAEPVEFGGAHRVGIFPSYEGEPEARATIGKHNHRRSHSMLSVMQTHGGRGGGPIHTWQASLDETAVVFATQPHIGVHRGEKRIDGQALVRAYETKMRSADGLHPLWAPGNMPPGTLGDLRPGYWQGNGFRPATFGEGALALSVYRIHDDATFPWVHVFFPRPAFDQIEEFEHWIAARKGNGYLAMWIPEGHQWTRRGFWRDRELRSLSQRNAMLATVGDASQHGDFDAFIASLPALKPSWDPDALLLGVTSPVDGARLTLNYDAGPARDGQPVPPPTQRFATPWGHMALGERDMALTVDGHRFTCDLAPMLSNS